MAEILDDQREPSEPLAGRVEERDAGPLAPESLARVGLVERELPELHEATEVVDAEEVEQLELPLEPREPPRETVGGVGGPVEHGHSPTLSLRMIERRRGARDHGVVEEVGMRHGIARVAGDVERDIADQADPSLVRVALQRQPLALEACLRSPLGLTREPHPFLEPVALRGAVVSLAAVVVPRARAAQAAPRTRRRQTGMSTGSRACRGCGAGGAATRTALLPRASRRTGRRLRRSFPRAAT